MAALDAWDSFYVIVGSSAGALIGLQFVVMTLIAERPSRRAAEASTAFGTPTVVHFGTALLLSALLRAPWPTVTGAAAATGAVGAGGLAYTLLTARRMYVQTAYAPDIEDWLCHALLPLTAYAALPASAFAALSLPREGLFGMGGATLLLLFIGIHNAWDSVAFLVFTNRQNAQNH
jgi:energy-converting hydrogenase Eha subunit A